MKSIEISSNSYEGITADATAISEDDVRQWHDSRDEQIIPAVIAALKGYMANVSVTALTLDSGATKSIAVGESFEVKATRTPDNSTKAITWTAVNADSDTDNHITITTDANDSRKAIVTGAVAGSTTLTATCDTSITATCTVTVSA